MLGGQGVHARVILVLRQRIWNAHAVSLVFQPFDDTGSLGSSPRSVVFPLCSMGPPWMSASRFLAGNREAELKPTLFLHSYFSMFSSLSSSPDSPAI